MTKSVAAAEFATPAPSLFSDSGTLAQNLVEAYLAVRDETERRAILEQVANAWNRTDLERMVAQSPLIEVSFPGLDA